MAYLRRLKIKLQSKFRNTERAFKESIFNTQVLVNTKPFITYSQWAHTILGSIIIGTILGYGKYYPVLSQMHYIFAIALAIIGVTVIKIMQSYCRWRLYANLLILVFAAMGLSYYHTDLQIINYSSYTSYYLQQEGEYLGTVVSSPEIVNLDGQEYYKYNVELHGLNPYKDTAKNDYIKAQGRLQIYSKVSTTKYSIRLGEQAIIEGTPKSLFLIEEEGRINLRGRYMSSNTRGRIYDGVYRSATNKDLQAFHFKETFSEKLYGKSLYVCGQIRESIEKNIASNLDVKGRLYQAKQALCICAILCLVYDPFSLFDVSFQLSFGATYGLLIWGKVLYERIQWLPKWIKTPLVLCVSAQLLILPLQLYYFHYISIASLLAACIVAPILDISIILIFISTVISYVMSISFLWSLIDALLRISLYLNHVLGRSGSLLWLGMMHLYCVYVYYTLLGLFTYFLTNKKEYTVYVVMSLLCMVAAYGVSYYVTHHNKNTLIHYIPMKQCNVLLCIAPNHEQAYLLIDAPDYIKTIPNERQINQTIRAYGMNPRMVKVKYFHSNGLARVIYKNGMSQIVVYNGQSREKNLKLNDKANVLFITSRFSVMHEIDRISPRSTVLFSSPHGALRDVDPSSEHMYIMGYSFIKDIYL